MPAATRSLVTVLMLAPVFPADGAQGSAFNEPLEDLDALGRVQPAHVLHDTGR